MKKQKKNPGFVLRILQSVVIWLFAAVIIVGMVPVIVEEANSAAQAKFLPIYIGILLAAAAWAVAYTILSVKGKRRKGANVATLFLGLPFLLFLILPGLCGLLGSIFGYKALKRKELSETEKETETGLSAAADGFGAEDAERAEAAAEFGAGAVTADAAAVDSAAETVKASAIVKRSDLKPKKYRYAVFGIVTAYYLAIFVMGVIGMCSDAMNGVWWSSDDAAMLTALNKVTSMLLISLVPTYGFYLARVAPFRFPNLAKIIIAAASAILTIALLVVYFVIFEQYRQTLSSGGNASIFGLFSDDKIFTVAPIAGVLGFAVCYGMTFLEMSPDSLRKKSVRKSDFGDGFTEVLKWIFMEIVCLSGNILKTLFRLRMKSLDLFTLLITVAFTLCVFVMAEIICIFLIFMAVGLFFAIVGSMYMKPTRSSYSLSDGGNSMTLQFDGYDSFGSRERYKDGNGNVWYTENGGASFYPDDVYNAAKRSEEKEALRND